MAATESAGGRKANLVFALHPRGLIVTGDTYSLKDKLKSEGGKWAPLEQGWTFPFSHKIPLLASLKSSGVLGSVKDQAILKLALDLCEKGLLLNGDTFQLKELLKSKGCRWEPSLKGWIVEASQKADLLASLRTSNLAEVTEAASCRGNAVDALALATPPRRAEASSRGREAASEVKARALALQEDYSSWPVPKLKDKLKELGISISGSKDSLVERLKACATAAGGRRPAEALATRKMALRPSPTGSALKVVETGRKSQQLVKGADGSQAVTKAQHQKRKVSCKRTGAHIETQSVTKKRKVIEKKGKVIEKATITVTRVRNK